MLGGCAPATAPTSSVESISFPHLSGGLQHRTARAFGGDV